jgi:hypothetical protein
MDNILEKRIDRILSISLKPPKEDSNQQENGSPVYNSLLKDALINLKIDKKFIENNITSKKKSDDGLPITYNPNLLQNHIKEQVEQEMVSYYSDYYDRVKGLTEIAAKIAENPSSEILSKIRHELKHNDFAVRKILTKIQKYEEEKSKLLIKKDILNTINEAIKITPEEEEILFEKDAKEMASESYTKDFEQKFLDALKKLDKIKEL